jgi:hypothetical protein
VLERLHHPVQGWGWVLFFLEPTTPAVDLLIIKGYRLAAVVVGAGTVVMIAAPSRPGLGIGGSASEVDDPAEKQALQLVAGHSPG